MRFLFKVQPSSLRDLGGCASHKAATRCRPQGSRRNAYFSLVELLVVISILAVLASLLQPSLRSALESSRDATCKAHHKSVGFGIIAFTDDHDNWLPALQGEGLYQRGTDHSYFHEISSYVGFEDELYPVGEGAWHPKKQENNPHMPPQILTCPSKTSDFLGIGWNYVGAGLSDVSEVQPRTMIARHRYVDAAGKVIEFERDPSRFFIIGDNGDDIHDNDNSIFLGKWNNFERIGQRHYLGLNLFYADGHVGSRLKMEIERRAEYDSSYHDQTWYGKRE